MKELELTKKIPAIGPTPAPTSNFWTTTKTTELRASTASEADGFRDILKLWAEMKDLLGEALWAPGTGLLIRSGRIISIEI